VNAADSTVLLAAKTNTLIQVANSTAQQLSNGQGTYMSSYEPGRSGTGHDQHSRGLVEFDPAAAIPAGARITSVMLTLDDVAD